MLSSIYIRVKNNNFLKNILGVGFFRVGGIITNFILVGVIYRYFSNDELNGIWLTVFSILSWITLLDLGIGNGLRNKLTQMLTNSDYKSARNYISTAYIIMSIPILLVFCVAAVISKYLDWNSIFNINYISISNNYLVCFIITVLGLYSINFYLTIIYAVMHAVFKSYLVTMIQFLVNFINIIIIFIFTLIGVNDLITLGVIYTGTSIIIMSIFSYFIFGYKYVCLKPSIKFFDKTIVKDIVKIGGKFLILQIAIIILFTTDNLIISKFIGVSEVTPYQLTSKLLGVFKIALGVILVPLWSYIINLKTTNNISEIKAVVRRMMVIFFVLALCTIITGSISHKIINLWIGKDIFISIELIIFMVIYNILHMWCDIFQNILNGLNKLKGQVIIYTIATIINIPISIYLVVNTKLGASAVILGTIVSLSIVAIFIPIIAFRELKRENC